MNPRKPFLIWRKDLHDKFKYYFNKNTMTTYIYSLDENHIVKINMNDKYNIIYSEDEILKMLIKKYTYRYKKYRYFIWCYDKNT